MGFLANVLILVLVSGHFRTPEIVIRNLGVLLYIMTVLSNLFVVGASETNSSTTGY